MKLGLRLGLGELGLLFRLFLTFSVGWVVGVGWLEKSDIKLISTHVVVEVEVGVELGNNLQIPF